MSTRSVSSLNSREPEGFKVNAARIYNVSDPEPLDNCAAGIDPLYAFSRRQPPATLEEGEEEGDSSQFEIRMDDDPISIVSDPLLEQVAPVVPARQQGLPSEPSTPSMLEIKTPSVASHGNVKKKPVLSHDSTRQNPSESGLFTYPNLIHAEAVGFAVAADAVLQNPIPSEKIKNKNRRTYFIAVAAVIVVIAIVVGIVVAVKGSDRATTSVESGPSFTKVGNDIVGPSGQLFFGSAVAVSSDGNRIVVASSGAVEAFELDSSGSTWNRIGQTIYVSETEANKLPSVLNQGLISVAMGTKGDIIAVGYGEAFNSTGKVDVYFYIGNTWKVLGSTPPGESTLLGESPGDRFGTSVDLSDQDSIVMAVGAPGYNEDAGSITVVKFNAMNETWDLLGEVIAGADSPVVKGMGGSVSLSWNGTRVAAGGRSIPGPTRLFAQPAVIRTFDYQTLNNSWNPLDAGFAAGELSSSTGWTVDLSADGNRMVVSNSYLTEADFVNTDIGGLVVQVFSFEEGEWKPFSDNLHANNSGPKSGYVVSFSDDGSIIGMGDPGTSSGGQNSNGHAHVYQDISGEFVQPDPNLVGASHSDRFGFSVALSGDGRRLVVGIPLNRQAGDDAGLVQVYETML